MNHFASLAVSCLLPISMIQSLPSAQDGSCQPKWTQTFGSQMWTGSSVHAFAEFDDGNGPAVFMGGDFHGVGGRSGAPFVNVHLVARWDGSEWSAPGSGLGGAGYPWVHALEVFDGGGGPALYAGGDFTSPGNRIARWNGSTWSPLGSGMSGDNQCYVEALAVFDDGRGPALYAGGRFSSAGGVPANNIARWDGTSWTPLGNGTSARVLALAVFDEGSGPALYAGGVFPTASGATVNSIARWDGEYWTALGSGMNGRVDDLAVFDDGGGPALYASGNFTTAGGIAAQYVARWDGASWSPLGNGMYRPVAAMGVFDDGSGDGPALYVGGCIPTGNGGCFASEVSKWDGSSWESFGPTGSAYGVSEVHALRGFDDRGELYAGGLPNDTRYGGGLARWNRLGWSPPENELAPGLASTTVSVASMTVFDDGSGGGPALQVGGDFIYAGGEVASNAATWDGQSWTELGLGLPLPRGTTSALAVFDDGAGGGPALYAGSAVLNDSGPGVAHVARREGSSWVPLGDGMTDGVGRASVSALAVFDDGGGPALYSGGRFTSAGGVPANYIAKWAGASWAPLGDGMHGSVNALIVFDDGSGPALYAGSNGAPQYFARWNGSDWSSVGGGMNSPVYAMAIFDDGSGPALCAGGRFTTAGGNPADHVARWDGAVWTALGSGVDNNVYALTIFDDGTGRALYAGGQFAHAGGVTAHSIARWNGTSWSSLGNGVSSGAVMALEIFDDGKGKGPALYAGGFFRESPAGDPLLARWTGCPDADPPVITCPAPIQIDDPGPPGEFVTFAVTASDRDPNATLVCEPPSGSFFARGTTLVTCTATDGSGNQVTCEFPVTVLQPRIRRR